MKYNLFLDDLRTPIDAYAYTGFLPHKNEHWKIVCNYDEFINYISYNYEKYNEMPYMVSFDHDLADQHYGANVNTNFKEKTGMECAKWLVEFCMDNNTKLPEFYIHSMNPVGGANIMTYLTNYIKVIENHGQK